MWCRDCFKFVPVEIKSLQLGVLSLFFLAACGEAEKQGEVFGSGDFGADTFGGFTIVVPQDYPSLASALAGKEVGQLPRNQKLEIKIENGHQIATNIDLRGGDYSNVRITCETTISLSNDFPADKHLFYGSQQTRLPIIDCLFDMRAHGLSGLVLTEASSAVLREGAGFLNSTHHAIRISGASRFSGFRAKLLGSLQSGFVVEEASMATCRECNVSNAEDYGFLANNASQLNIPDAIANNTGLTAIYAKAASSIHAERASAVNAGGHGALANNVSRLNFNGGFANGAKEHGIYALRGSSISAYQSNANITGKIGIFAQSASIVSADNSMANNAGATAIHATRASLIDAEGTEANDAEEHGVLANSVSRLNFNGGFANGAKAHGIYALRGSSISAFRAQANYAAKHGIISRGASTVEAQEAQANYAGVSNLHSTQVSLLNFYQGQAFEMSETALHSAIVYFGGLLGLGLTEGITTNLESNQLSAEGAVLK